MEATVSHRVGMSMSKRRHMERLEWWGADADRAQTKHRCMSKHRQRQAVKKHRRRRQHTTPHHRDCFQGSINPPRAGHNNLHLHYVLCKCCCRGDQILEALQLLTSSLLMCTNSDPAAKVIRLQGHLLRGGSSARVLLWDLEQICSLLLTYFWHFQDVLFRNETRPSCDQGKLIS